MQLLFFLSASESSNGDLGFVIGLLVLVLAGLGLVLWSRRRGSKAPDARRDVEEALRAEQTEEEEEERAPHKAPTPATPAAPRKVPPPVVEKPRVVPPEPAKKPLLPLEPEGRSIEQGLEKTRTQGFVSRLAGLFKKQLDENLEEAMEEVLLTSDIGVRTAEKLLKSLREDLSRNDLRDQDRVWGNLRSQVETILTQSNQPEAQIEGPRVIAIVGVNGTGKTTTMGKLAHRYTQEGHKVQMVAADTFRAAAADQLEVWANRTGAGIYRGKDAQDPASVAFDGIKAGVEQNADIIMVDTAGRLHTKKHLLEELKKITKVCGKALPGSPHETYLVLDATTGQNAIQQAEIFHGEVGLSGIVLTKLDGTAKGGVVIGICDMMGLPVRYVGVGEGINDLSPFDAHSFVNGLFGRSS